MKKKYQNIDKLSELLPDGLTEETVNKIALVINTIIEEDVKERFSILESKVAAFIRLNMDSVKESALSELTEESEVYRNSNLMESIKTLLAFEISEENEDSAIEVVQEGNKDLEEENKLLVEELQEVYGKLQNLETSLKISSTRLNKLTEEKTKLTESNKVLESKSTLPVKSSEKAIVISENMNEISKEKGNQKYSNPLLTEEIMALMPKGK